MNFSIPTHLVLYIMQIIIYHVNKQNDCLRCCNHIIVSRRTGALITIVIMYSPANKTEERMCFVSADIRKVLRLVIQAVGFLSPSPSVSLKCFSFPVLPLTSSPLSLHQLAVDFTLIHTTLGKIFFLLNF